MSSITSTFRKTGLTSALAAAITAAAMIPAGASAATTFFGSSLNHEPANVGSGCEESNPDTAVPCTHVGSFYPGSSGRVQAGVTGTITKVRVRAAGPMTMRFKVVNVRSLSRDHRTGQVKTIAASRMLRFSGPSQDQLNNGISPIESANVHVKVQRGQEVAIDTSNNQAEYCSDGTPGQLTFFKPLLSLGGGFRSAQGVDDCLLLVQAVIAR